MQKKIKEDKLDEIMKLQLAFMKRIDMNPDKMSMYIREGVTKEVVLAMHSELSEVLNEINWKPWKKKKKDIDEHKIKIEIIDLMRFLLELAIIWGLDAKDLFMYYKVKNKINQKRQNDGY